MHFYQECLRIVEDNKNNPHPKIYFMTMCLKHWSSRIFIYSAMKNISFSDTERRALDHNCFGEDTLLKRLIKEGYLVQGMLNLLLESQAIERDMYRKDTFDRNHLVIPKLEKLTVLLLPIWKEEVLKLKIQKDHPEIKQIIYFLLNLRDYKKDNEAYINFFLKLLNENC